MTAVANETTLDVDVEVRFTPAGTPLAVRHEGRIWAVAADPVHWFARDAWWDTRLTAAVGSGDLVSIEFWQVQVRLGSNSALRTFTLRRVPLSTQWLMESISD
ncbi:hypothetical protein SAMN05660473_00681 [Arthrobacter sp. 49Tsu3.1M3]|uniref:hypothetical protein n=1 Tax=Arthrobacter sp. 49Tsu3.1M3 TaxID=1279029 RepID=UPI0009CC0ECA|nr:hypothetical protein [Arthrobacter sp. 49Tsu3.1M3]SKB43707.1 hypothetical protein SAMN05660473_00681 [Arthrobacter sp. 49Tsu3.1M3]